MKPSQVFMTPDAAFIRVKGSFGGEDYAIIDNCDLPVVACRSWRLGTDGYARCKATLSEKAQGAPGLIAMHRLILGLHLSKGKPGELEVDHRSGDKLDNRRAELRQASRSQNSMNRRIGPSGFRGVSFFKPAKLWKAQLGINGKNKCLGYRKTPEEAARLWDEHAKRVFGHFARLNFPDAER